VLEAVPGEERHCFALDLADREWCGRGAVRRLDRHLLDILQERIEAGSSEDSDVRSAHADFSDDDDEEPGSFFELPESLDPVELLPDEESLEESLDESFEEEEDEPEDDLLLVSVE
jgi:hypothetical protein